MRSSPRLSAPLDGRKRAHGSGAALALARVTAAVAISFLGCAAAPSPRHAGAPPIAEPVAEHNDRPRRKPDPAIPGMVGATRAPFDIGPEMTSVALEMFLAEAPARLPDQVKRTVVTLAVENMTGDKRAPPFTVYLNLPDGDAPERHPELMAGSVGGFGLVESSDPAAGGRGLTTSLDVTELFDRLRLTKEWDPRTLKVSFAPSGWDAPVPRVRVGRVSLHSRSR